jgi:DNA-binding transcriptional ArsR family regulator
MRELAPVAERSEGADPEIVRALSHPTRLEIMIALQGRVASPVQLAREIDTTPGVISYHAGALVSCGCLEVVHVEPRQGTFERFFGVTPGAAF